MENKKWTVYEHICPNGKRYIGITCKKPERRWKNGRGYEKGTAFRKAIEKYKWENIQHNIVSTDLTEKEAKWLENYLICYYRTFVGFKDDCKGYNCTLGGDGQVGWEQSEETKKKISKSRKGKLCGEQHPMYGKHHTEESCRMMSDSKKGKTTWSKGKHFSEEHCKNISISHKGKLCGESNPFYGKKHTEEQKKKWSESKKGKLCGESNPMYGKISPNRGKHRVYREDGTYFYN